jgi:hypothetical protein
MTDVDPAAIDREKQALKRAFTYRSLRHDLDWLLDDTDRAMFAEANLAGRGLYAVASQFVLDCYYERGALEPLVNSYSGQPYRVASRFDRLLQHLQEAQRVDLIERFWTSIARLTGAEFFYQRPRRDHGDHAGAEEFKNYALEAYAHGIDWLTRLGRLDAAERLTEERNALREEHVPCLPAPSDLRRMDEPVFWELMSKARSHASTTREQVAALGESLRPFKAAEIKRFGSFYAKTMKKLYHWNVWALAYAARGGCSDGAFEAFRSWLILQGDPALVALAVTDPTQAAARVPPEPDLPDDGNCLSMIAEAYLLRNGSSLELPSIDLDKPKGKEWTEAAFATIYPHLVRHYASVTEL